MIGVDLVAIGFLIALILWIVDKDGIQGRGMTKDDAIHGWACDFEHKASLSFL